MVSEIRAETGRVQMEAGEWTWPHCREQKQKTDKKRKLKSTFDLNVSD